MPSTTALLGKVNPYWLQKSQLVKLPSAVETNVAVAYVSSDRRALFGWLHPVAAPEKN
jgi:hypothetical protein